MEMKIDSTAVKVLRKKKLWSQQELATACGVSLRTIQRLENEGQASADTMKALAAVFEVGYETLDGSDQTSSNYVNIQMGYYLILTLITVAVGLTVLMGETTIIIGDHVWIYGASMLVLALVVTLLSTLTTKISDSVLEWHFSLGFLRKTVPINEIISSKTVRNKAWWGLGIRLTPSGWLYCVSGLDAVALRLADGRKIRIGTDEPEELNRAIESALMRNAAISSVKA